jgi:hypothetical protein
LKRCEACRAALRAQGLWVDKKKDERLIIARDSIVPFDERAVR